MLIIIQKLIKNTIDYFRKPYDLLNDNRIRILFPVLYTLLVFLFILLFCPFGIVLYADFTKLKLILLLCIFNFFICAFHIYWLQNIIIKKHTIRSTFIWLAWINLVIGFNNFIVYEVYLNKGIFIWKYLPNMLLSTVLIGLFPLIVIILIYNGYYLKKKIRVINQINANLSRYQSIIPAKSDLTLTSTNLREAVTVDSNSLLYIASADNYVEIFWLEKRQINKCLLRKTLTEIENEMKKQWQHIERCHNSYIVNINQIKSISGNTGGYRILLNGIDTPIPVSRKYSDNFLKLLNQ